MFKTTLQKFLDMALQANVDAAGPFVDRDQPVEQIYSRCIGILESAAAPAKNIRLSSCHYSFVDAADSQESSLERRIMLEESLRTTS